MNYKHILITGGAGFVGSTLCIKFKEYYPSLEVVALDNLKRRGSELNLPRLKRKGVRFIHGDIRNKDDINVGPFDLLIECSAEPSVMAGVTSSPEYLVNTNLSGAINCFEEARKKRADILFLSTSRVYPIAPLNNLKFLTKNTRFELSKTQAVPGASANGISESFSLNGVRSLYGATKLAAELLLLEYGNNYQIKTVINRFGLITGPWQMGKIDQGVVVHWMAGHFFRKPLSYIGFNGEGKQVRDLLHVDDVFECLLLQLKNMGKVDGQIFNVGGGLTNSVSLRELTNLCEKITNHKVPVKKINENRPGDIKSYISDTSKISTLLGWKPTKNINQTLQEVYLWIRDNKILLENIL